MPSDLQSSALMLTRDFRVEDTTFQEIRYGALHFQDLIPFFYIWGLEQIS